MTCPPLGLVTRASFVPQSPAEAKHMHQSADRPRVEVLYIHIAVRRCLPLAPQEQAFFGRGFWAERVGSVSWGGLSTSPPTLTASLPLTLYGDVLDGKAQNDGPDHAQGHLQVPVDDLCRRHRVMPGQIPPGLQGL